MNDEIKSAREIALEKIAGLEAVTPDEKLKWKYVPEGEKLALKYLKTGQDINSAASSLPREARTYILDGAEDVLSSAIQLPINETVVARNTKAIDGLLSIKQNKADATRILDQIKQVLEHYTSQGDEQRKQAYNTLKQQFESRLKQAVSQQMYMDADADLGITVESLPQFQEEWRRTAAQMDEQYLKLLEEFKHELSKIK